MTPNENSSVIVLENKLDAFTEYAVKSPAQVRDCETDAERFSQFITVERGKLFVVETSFVHRRL